MLDRDSARLIALKRIPLTQHSRETVSAMAEEVRRRARSPHGQRHSSSSASAVWAPTAAGLWLCGCAQATTLAQLSHENVLKCFGHR